MVHTWAESGRALPVAVVVSIIDDVCEALAAAPPGDDVAISLDHVIIDQAGVARITVRPREAVPAVSSLLREALAAGRGDEAIPAAAWEVLGQGLAEDPWVRPASTDVIQQQLRDALGPPAARDEVLGCCAVMRGVVSPAPSMAGPSIAAPSIATPVAPPIAPVAAVQHAAPRDQAEPVTLPPWEVRSILPVEVDLASLSPRLRDSARANDPRGRDVHTEATEVMVPLEVPSMVGPASELTAAMPEVLVAPQVSEVAVAEPVPAHVVEPVAAVAASAVEPVAGHAMAALEPMAMPERATPAEALSKPAPKATSAAAPGPTAREAWAPEAVPSEPVGAASEPVAAAPELVAPIAPPDPDPSLAPPPLPRGASSRPPEASVSPRVAVTATLPEDLEGPPSLLPRPVVRHEPPRRRPVSLPAAPAARLGSSGAPSLDESSIQLPSESPAQKLLIGILAIASAILVAWLLGLL